MLAKILPSRGEEQFLLLTTAKKRVKIACAAFFCRTCHILGQKFAYLDFSSYLCRRFRTRSSMDRIKDSGSFDYGSTPYGFTPRCIIACRWCTFFVCSAFSSMQPLSHLCNLLLYEVDLLETRRLCCIRTLLISEPE